MNIKLLTHKPWFVLCLDEGGRSQVSGFVRMADVFGETWGR